MVAMTIATHFQRRIEAKKRNYHGHSRTQADIVILTLGFQRERSPPLLPGAAAALARPEQKAWGFWAEGLGI